VLKVGWQDEEAAYEADGPRACDSSGAVWLVNAMVVGQTNALLLEACERGNTLSEVYRPRHRLLSSPVYCVGCGSRLHPDIDSCCVYVASHAFSRRSRLPVC
jgi:hypothetical protein